jgi:P27 family predicted phage terminase small subunit
MGQRGPAPLPGVTHLRNGNPSKKAVAELLNGLRVPVVIPNCPGHLVPAAKKEWKRITPLLAELGLVAEIDMAALAMYCQAYGRWHDAERKIRELNKADPKREAGLIGHTPSGYQQMSVWLQIANREREFIGKMLAEFGLSPSARARVQPQDVQLELPGLEKGKGEEKTGTVIGFPAL